MIRRNGKKQRGDDKKENRTGTTKRKHAAVLNRQRVVDHGLWAPLRMQMHSEPLSTVHSMEIGKS